MMELISNAVGFGLAAWNAGFYQLDTKTLADELSEYIVTVLESKGIIR